MDGDAAEAWRHTESHGADGRTHVFRFFWLPLDRAWVLAGAQGNFVGRLQDEPRWAPTLMGERVVLRAAELSDRDARLAAGNDEGAIRGYGGEWDPRHVFGRAGADRWYRRFVEAPAGWVIAIDGRPIGNVSLGSHPLKPRCSTLAIGSWRPEDRDRGFGTEAVQLVTRHAFTDLDLHRIELRVLVSNLRAVRSYEKSGFSVESRERDTAFAAGHWQDDLIMVLFEPGRTRTAGADI